MRKFKLFCTGLMALNLRLFDPPNPNTNVTTANDLSVEMKTFYSDYLIELTEAELVHDQFGQQHPIPRNNGKTIEFRQYDPLPEMTTPLTEGVTPDGQSLKVTNKTATVKQYGGYVTLSDMLELTAIDNNLVHATEMVGSQAGRTLDTITREVINSGTNVQYADGRVSARTALVGGSDTAANNHYMNTTAIRMAARTLDAQDAPKIDGYYVGIIHPNVAYDLMSDPNWRAPHEYVDTEHVYKGELGELYGVRFVRASRAKVFQAEDLASDSRTLTVNAADGLSAATTVPFDGGTVAANALKGRYVLIGTTKTKVTANTANQLTVETAVTCADNAVIYPGEAGAGGRDVYSTLILAKNAYGVTEVQGGGLEHIVKQLGSGGTADALNQRATTGWKATKTAEILVEQYMVRIETTASAG